MPQITLHFCLVLCVQLRFALIRYDHSVFIDLTLEDSVLYSLPGLKNKIDELKYTGGSTLTDVALKEVRGKIFNGAPRHGVARTCIVITDGKSHGGAEKVRQPSNDLRVWYHNSHHLVTDELKIPRCDWLPDRARWSHIARSGFLACIVPQDQRSCFFGVLSHIINILLTKLVRSRWLDIVARLLLGP